MAETLQEIQQGITLADDDIRSKHTNSGTYALGRNIRINVKRGTVLHLARQNFSYVAHRWCKKAKMHPCWLFFSIYFTFSAQTVKWI